MLLGAGCQMVHVQDEEGKGISWAEVRVRTATSESKFPVMTDFFGNATLLTTSEPEGTQEFLEVSKDGYIPVNNFARTREGTMIVTLRKMRAVPAEATPAWKTPAETTTPSRP